MRYALLIACLLLPGCAYRSIETAIGTRYRSLHVLHRQDIATLGARAGDASFFLRGYAYAPDAESTKALADAALKLP